MGQGIRLGIGLCTEHETGLRFCIGRDNRHAAWHAAWH